VRYSEREASPTCRYGPLCHVDDDFAEVRSRSHVLVGRVNLVEAEHFVDQDAHCLAVTVGSRAVARARAGRRRRALEAAVTARRTRRVLVPARHPGDQRVTLAASLIKFIILASFCRMRYCRLYNKLYTITPLDGAHHQGIER
jgi:hypothetical protein